jgi:hypothetical protein
MSEFKGTKGKWFIQDSPYLNEKDNENHGSFNIRNEEKKMVSQLTAYSFYGIKSIEEANYNALLVSKAPEMLELLMTIENDSNQVPKWLWDKIQTLIKEATEL